MDRYPYVIVGGGLAGGRACEGIRRIDSDGPVMLITAEPHRPYQRPPLSKAYLMGKAGLDKVYLQEEGYYGAHDIEIMAGTTVARIDRGDHTVTLEGGRVVGYERLLLATGGSAIRLPLPGADLPGVHVLRTIEDSDRIREDASNARRMLIIGGSFIGSEVSSSLSQRGVEGAMVFLEDRLLERVVPKSLSHHLTHMYAEHGVRVLPGVKPVRLEGEGRVQRAVLDNGETLDVDMVVMGVGIRLNTGLARDAGLELGDRDAVIVDAYLRTSDPDIYAAGDIAAWPDPTLGSGSAASSGRRLRVEHWDVARAQGLRAGRNMAGEERAYTTLPYFFSDLYDLSFEVWGNLEGWDATVQRGELDGGPFAFFYFKEGRMVGALAADLPDDDRKPLQALIKRRPSLEDASARLADPSASLASL
jgi:3-phenylpropionate/trans-cinnamate dioxygenase ferredoxin reductase component